MRLPSWLTRIKATVSPMTADSPLNQYWGGWSRILEPFAGAWQRNISYSRETILTFYAVYACLRLIVTDVGKLRIRLVELDRNGIWQETENPAYSPVLRKPNRYQTRIRFFEQWMTTKLIHGNSYILKFRDNRNVVQGLVVLDPTRVRVLVAPDGEIFYQLGDDNLTGADEVTVPSSEIIHDLMTPLYHPLVGVSPLTACGLAASLGLKGLESSARLFGNDSRPSGLLTSPVTIPKETADRLQSEWQLNFSGENFGKVAVLGNGLEYKAMAITAEQAQMIEQLKLSAEAVCTAFGVPAYKVGVGSAPTYNNINALNQEYYSQCLQMHLESIELLLDEGLGLLKPGERQILGTEFDLDDLIRMDSASRVSAAKESANGGGLTFNEVRKRYHGVGPVPGGDVVLSQQQNFSLEALAKRDAREDPFASSDKQPQRQLNEPTDEADDEDDTDEKSVTLADIRTAILTKAAALFEGRAA